MRHEARKKTTMRWFWPLINNTLHWSLFLSIALFLSGLLFQSWCLSMTYVRYTPILFATSEISTLFTLIAWFAIAAATVHGVVRIDSPFSGTLSRMIRKLFALPTRIQERYTAAIEKEEGEGDSLLLEKAEGLNDKLQARREAVKTYAQLLSEVQEPDLLERAVPALQLKEWIFTTDLPVLDSFSTAYTRLISSDNSPRVRAMMNEHILHFGEWLSVAWPRLKLPSNEIAIVKWCQLECARLVAASGELRRMILPSFGFFSSFSHGSRRLREFYQLPYKQFLIHILCTFDRGSDRDGGLKHRRLLFWSAIDECSILLEKESAKAFSDISRASRVSIIQSVIGSPNPAWHELPQIVKQFLKGDETQMLQDLAPLLTRLPDVDASSSSALVFDLLEILVQGLPVDFHLPGNLDLSRILHVASRRITRETQKSHCDTILLCLEHSDLSVISDIPSLLQFLQVCMAIPAHRGDEQQPPPNSIHNRALSIRSRVQLLHKRVDPHGHSSSALRRVCESPSQPFVSSDANIRLPVVLDPVMRYSDVHSRNASKSYSASF